MAGAVINADSDIGDYVILNYDFNRLPVTEPSGAYAANDEVANYDRIVYVPLETPLLAAARARQISCVEGLGMLLYQAVPGFRTWFGVDPTVDEDLRRFVAADLLPA